jgi:site-specific DNA-methyltransferase (adenine-specific)
MKPYYQDSAVTIFHADSREWLAATPECYRVNAVVTSPPYGDIREYGGHGPVDTLAIISQLALHLEVGGVIMWNTADQTVDGSESGLSFKQALHAKECGLRLYDTMIYCKEVVSFPDSNRYHPAFEYMFIFSQGAPAHFNGIADRKNKWAGSTIHGPGRQPDGSMKPKPRDGELVPDMGLRWNWWIM